MRKKGMNCVDDGNGVTSVSGVPSAAGMVESM